MPPTNARLVAVVACGAMLIMPSGPALAESAVEEFRGYRAWRVFAEEGGRFHVLAGGRMVDAGHLARGFWMWPVDRFDQRVSSTGLLSTESEEVYLQSSLNEGVDLRDHRNLRCHLYASLAPDLKCHLFAAAHFTFPESGEYYVVAMGAMDGPSDAGLTVVDATGVTILGESRGEAVFVPPRDFRGQASLGLKAVLSPVRVASGAQVGLEVEHTLFGYFWYVDAFTPWADCPGWVDMGWQGPSGGSGARYTGFDAAPPGAYAFRVNAMAVACPAPSAGVWLFAADVALP